MGYDCTLHSLDEKLISGPFVDFLLAGIPPKAKTGVDAGLWRDTFKSLKSDPPDEAASTVCQLALIFAATKHPYHYERGFSLCLWPEMDEEIAAEIPEKLTASPEQLFPRLVQAYPKLAGNFPTSFSGNYSTGTFIPAQKITKALQWVERKSKAVSEGDRDPMLALTLVLKHCAQRKLAYWEATDLPVPMATISALSADPERAARKFIWPEDGFYALAQHNHLIILEPRLRSVNENARSALADFSTWPPSLDWLPEYATYACFSASGKLVTVAAEPGTGFYAVRLRAHATSKAQPAILKEPKSEPVSENGYDVACFFGETVVALKLFQKDRTKKRFPLFQQGKQLTAEKLFQAANDNHEDYMGGESMGFGIARTRSGAQVLLWGNQGWELTKAGLKPTFPLTRGKYAPDGKPTVPGGNDGFFYLADRCLFEVNRHQPAVQHLPKITNIMTIRPGPDGAIVLQEGHNSQGAWGKIYWPETRTMINLKPSVFPELPRRDLRSIYWLESGQRLLFFYDEEVWYVPWEEIATLPRSKV